MIGDIATCPQFGLSFAEIYDDPYCEAGWEPQLYHNGFVGSHTDNYNSLTIIVEEVIQNGLWLVHRENKRLVRTKMIKGQKYTFRPRTLHALYNDGMSKKVVERQTFNFKECREFDKMCDTEQNKYVLIKFRFKVVK